MPEPNPEQVTPVLSLFLWTFLDPFILKGSRMPRIPYEEFPPLADSDYAKNLRTMSFPYMDIFASGKKGHIFWPLMKVFSG